MPLYIIVNSATYDVYKREYDAYEHTGHRLTHPLADYSKWVLESLAKIVNILLKEGWVCTGGIQVISHGGSIGGAMQSMVKND